MIVTEQTYINLLRSEVVPALGCTEPIAVALAVARAREALPGKCPRAPISIKTVWGSESQALAKPG